MTTPQRPPVVVDYLAGYPAPLVDEVRRLIAAGGFARALLRRYPRAHAVRTDRTLYDYVEQIRGDYLRNSAPLSRVIYDSRLHVVQQALGLHTRSARVQGTRLKTRREIRIAALFRETPPEFLRMIVVHELAHLKEGAHDKAFYQLCRSIEPDYHQYEFDLRAYLCHLAASGTPLWPAGAQGASAV